MHEGCTKTSFHTMQFRQILETLCSVVMELLSVSDRQLNALLEDTHRKKSLLSIYCGLRPTRGTFSSTVKMIQLLARKEKDGSRSKVAFSGLMEQLNDILRISRTIGVDGCMFDVTSSSSSRSGSSDSRENSAYESGNNFRDILDRASRTKKSLSRHFISNNLRNLVSPQHVSEHSTEPNYYRFHFKLSSTLREQSLLPVLAREAFRELSKMYIEQFMNWLLAGPSSRGRDVALAVSHCVDHTMRAAADKDERDYSNSGTHCTVF